MLRKVNPVDLSLVALAVIAVMISIAIGCPAKQETSNTEATTNTPATGTDSPEPRMAENEEPKTDRSRKELIPPYLTISGVELPDEVILRPGQVVSAYYEVKEPLPADAWLGMIPTSVTACDAVSNRAATLEYKSIGGETMGQLSVIQQEEGEFIFRIFGGTSAEDEILLESESWGVVPVSDSAK